MTNRPIPRRGLIGALFLSDRGITYDAGKDEAIDRSGRGNHATYQNGVTVGVSGDPSREFGAADFDAASNQFATFNSTLAVDGSQAVTMVVKIESLGEIGFARLFSNRGNGGMEIFKTNDPDVLGVEVGDGTTDINLTFSNLGVGPNEFFTVTTFVNNGVLGAYIGDQLSDSKPISGVTAGTAIATIASSGGTVTLNAEIAAFGRYDLTVPDAPEPSEIARRWDRLTDIPATR